MSDRNYQSYTGNDVVESDVVLDPQPPEWPVGSWQDTMKLSRCVAGEFRDFHIVRGGTEDAIDINNRSSWNTLDSFTVCSGGRYVLTLKGGSSDNTLREFFVGQGGSFVDCAFGEWSDQSTANSVKNRLISWRKVGGGPITYAYRWGNKPLWVDSYVKHLWWLSIGITVHWWAKYLWRAITGKLPKGA